MPDHPQSLLDDRAVAQHLSVSRSWVRQQRYRRRHGMPHTFDVEPIYIGDLPRYTREAFFKWLKEQTANDPQAPEQ